MTKAILFDLYGTLIDIKTDEHDPYVYEILSRYLGYHSVNIAPDEMKRAYFEGIQHYLDQSKEVHPEVDVYNIFFNIMNKYGKKRSTKTNVMDIATLFRSLTMRQFRVHEGIYDVLLALSARYKTAIISDAQWLYAEPEIAKLGLDQFFEVRILSSRFGFKKPDPRLFRAAMEKIGVSSGDCIYVGDNPCKDLSGAKRVGMKFILFRSECREYNGFEPDRCFDDYAYFTNTLSGLL
jgi:putative hydrolase of the HAD superfamily